MGGRTTPQGICVLKCWFNKYIIYWLSLVILFRWYFLFYYVFWYDINDLLSLFCQINVKLHFCVRVMVHPPSSSLIEDGFQKYCQDVPLLPHPPPKKKKTNSLAKIYFQQSNVLIKSSIYYLLFTFATLKQSTLS